MTLRFWDEGGTETFKVWRGDVSFMLVLFTFWPGDGRVGKGRGCAEGVADREVFSKPLARCNFTQNLKRQHSKKWSEYQRCRESNKTPDSEGTKLEFFEMGSCVPFASTIKSHLDVGRKNIFCIDEKIVTNVISERLFDPATTHERHDAAMSIFRQNEGDVEANQA
jgi:hypothetical protein